MAKLYFFVCESLYDFLKNPELSSNFSEEFATRIGERSRELLRLEIRFTLLLLPFIFLLGVFNSEFIQEITIFGISLSKDGATLNVLLLISSILMLFSSAFSLMQSYYSSLLTAYIEANNDEVMVKYIMHQFEWNIGTFLDGLNKRDENISHSKISAMIVGFWLISLLCAIFLLQILVLLIFFGAILSASNVSGIPSFINISVVVFAACVLVFDVTCQLLKCPIPFTDRSNIEKINELEKTNPNLAGEIRQKIARKELHKDRRNSIILQVIVLFVFLITPTWFAIGKDMFSTYEIVPKILFSLVIVLMLISPIIDKFENLMLARVFKITDEELMLKRYIVTRKRIWRMRLIMAAAIGLVVSTWHF